MLNTKGEYAGVSMYDEKSNINYAVCTEEGAKALSCEPFLKGTATE